VEAGDDVRQSADLVHFVMLFLLFGSVYRWLVYHWRKSSIQPSRLSLRSTCQLRSTAYTHLKS